MATTDEQERELRIDQMTVNIEKMRFDIAETQRQSAVNQRWETRKFVVSLLLATAALLGAGIAVGSYFTKQPPPPIIIQVPSPVQPG